MVNDNNWFFKQEFSVLTVLTVYLQSFSLIPQSYLFQSSTTRNLETGEGGEKKSIHENYSKFSLPLYKYIITQLMR